MSVYVRPYSETDGQIAYASSVNKYVNDFASTVNALNSANLVASAVGSTQLEQNAVTAPKVDYELQLYHEVFS